MTDTARLQELEDREQIRQIFVDYGKYLDAGDHAGYASLFSEDGVFVAPLGEAVGPAAIEEVLDKTLGPQVRGHLPEAIHIMNNQRIDIDGDTATTVVVWFYLTSDDDNPNSAAVRFLVDGAETDELAGYERIVYLFDGHDEAAVARAREQWKAARDSGCEVTYWQQSPQGRWEKKA